MTEVLILCKCKIQSLKLSMNKLPWNSESLKWPLLVPSGFWISTSVVFWDALCVWLSALFYFLLPMWFRQGEGHTSSKVDVRKRRLSLAFTLKGKNHSATWNHECIQITFHYIPTKKLDFQTWLVRKITCQMLIGVLSNNTGEHNFQAGITLFIVIASGSYESFHRWLLHGRTEFFI